MKKALCAVMALALVFLFCACGTGKVYEAAAKDFSVEGMTITLTWRFSEENAEGYTACYDSKEAAVFLLKEDFSMLAGLEDYTLAEYAEAVRKSNEQRSPEQVTQKEGLLTFEYEFYDEAQSVTYHYLAVVYKATDAFWLVQFASPASLYEEYEPYFLTWAKSVTFTAK